MIIDNEDVYDVDYSYEESSSQDLCSSTEEGSESGEYITSCIVRPDIE